MAYGDESQQQAISGQQDKSSSNSTIKVDYKISHIDELSNIDVQFSSKFLVSKLNETNQETISNKTYHKCFSFEVVPNPDFLKKQEDWRLYDRSY